MATKKVKSGKKAAILSLSGVVGYEIVPDTVRESLDSFKGADVEVQISTPGGFISDGLEIYNLLDRYSGHITVRLMGVVASMGTYIAMVGDEIIAQDNAVFMIHNAIGGAYGNHLIMRKVAAVLEGLSSLLSKKYVDQTQRSDFEIRNFMDQDSFFYGDDILKYGFVDSMEATGKAADKDTDVSEARALVELCNSKMLGSELYMENILKAAAFFDIDASENKIMKDEGGDNKQDEVVFAFLTCDTCGYTEDFMADLLGTDCPKCAGKLLGSNIKRVEVNGMKTLKEILAIQDSAERGTALADYFKDLLDGPEKASLVAFFSEMSPEDSGLAKVVDSLQLELKGLTDQMVETKAELSTERDTRRKMEVTKQLTDMKAVGDLSDMADMVVSSEKTDPETAKKLLKMYADNAAALQNSGLFKEAGNTGEGDPKGTSYEKLKVLVDARVEETKMAPSKAWKAIIKENGELYAAYLKERHT